jgi:hypothetical protein
VKKGRKKGEYGPKMETKDGRTTRTGKQLKKKNGKGGKEIKWNK